MKRLYFLAGILFLFACHAKDEHSYRRLYQNDRELFAKIQNVRKEVFNNNDFARVEFTLGATTFHQTAFSQELSEGSLHDFLKKDRRKIRGFMYKNNIKRILLLEHREEYIFKRADRLVITDSAYKDNGILIDEHVYYHPVSTEIEEAEDDRS